MHAMVLHCHAVTLQNLVENRTEDFIYIFNFLIIEEFGVGVSVNQGSVLSSLLFILVLEALSRQFHSGVPWEFLYADDFAVLADSMEEIVLLG